MTYIGSFLNLWGTFTFSALTDVNLLGNSFTKLSMLQFLLHKIANISTFCMANVTGVAPGIFRRGAESSDEGAKIWLSGYYKCQKSQKKIAFHLPTGGWHAPTGGYSPLALPWRHHCNYLNKRQIPHHTEETPLTRMTQILEMQFYSLN